MRRVEDIWNYERLHRRLSRFGASVVACLLFWATRGSVSLEKKAWYETEDNRRYPRWEGVEREEEGASQRLGDLMKTAEW